MEDVEFRDGKPTYCHFIQNTMYKVMLFGNGMVKFVPFDQSLANKAALTRLESKGWIDCRKNVKYANRFSSFSMAILEKNDGRIKRFNRPNEDNDYFFTAKK